MYRAGSYCFSHEACHTNASLPSQNLVKSICYPEAYRFITKATQWGCTHEAVAKEHYVKVRQESHADMSVVECGLVINPEWPHLGASPDGIVQCIPVVEKVFLRLSAHTANMINTLNTVKNGVL